MERLYTVIEARDGVTLARRVNERIEMRFEPIGGVSVVRDPNDNCLYFYQAMMMKET